ncbi:MAG: hypothetical protein V3S89_07675 [Desulfobacterales bacterium]
MIRSILHKIHTRVLAYSWTFIFPPAALLTLVLTFEETYTTWVHGSRTIGYVFSYTFPPVMLICLFSTYLCYAWIGTLIVTSLLTTAAPSRSDCIKASLIVGTVAIEWVTVDQWQAMLGWFLGR